MLLSEEYFSKIKVLNEILWDGRATKSDIESWLNNFSEEERIYMLHILSKFIYINPLCIRKLLVFLFKDLYKRPIIAEIRRKNDDTLDMGLIKDEFSTELSQTKFIGIGNPSESGCHLLYFFRQENSLSINNFMHIHEFFSLDGKINGQYKSINRLIFIDDFCGTGRQVFKYLNDFCEKLKANTRIRKYYYSLVATEEGLSFLRSKKILDDVSACLTLDSSFKSFSPISRIIEKKEDRERSMNIAFRYGKELLCKNKNLKLARKCALGYGDCQLLLGFYHNTPNNTLPIIWFDEDQYNFKSIFKRYNKQYTI